MSQGASDSQDQTAPTSAFFRAHASELVATAALGPTLDLASGRGRHALAAAALGLSVTAVDANSAALEHLSARWRERNEREIGTLETLCADLETPPLPDLEPAHYGAILVFNYLHRALFPWIASRLAPGGLVLYETFTETQRTLGWGPKREAFLLKSGELPNCLPGLRIEVYEEGLSKDARPAFTARLLARHSLSSGDEHSR